MVGDALANWACGSRDAKYDDYCSFWSCFVCNAFFDFVHPPAGAHCIVVTQGVLSLQNTEPLFIGLITLVIIGMLVKEVELALR